MCDVLVALPDATRHGKVVFGKNSDRPAGECQPLHYSPGGKRSGQVQCSYVAVPETGRALATFGCRPYWCWGYETGLNEAGVAGGNAAVFTRGLRQASREEKPGLTGMDLLRFGLERGESAEQAVDVITRLLEQYGQFGSAVQGQDHAAGAYDNSFLLADPKEAWVVETSGRRWAAERVTRGVRSISNQLSIRDRGTKSSADLADYARQQGWGRGDGEFDFAFAYADHEHYSRQVSHLRWKRSQHLLRRHAREIDAPLMMKFLRDHYEDTFLEGPQFHPYLPDFMTLCMHDSPAGFTWGNTATSVAVELDANASGPTPFWLAYLPPCSSLYTAYFLGARIPDAVTRAGTAGMNVQRPPQAPKDRFSDSSLWWRFHRLAEETAKEPLARQRELRTVLDPVEKQSLAQVDALWQRGGAPSTEELTRLVSEEVEAMSTAVETLEERWKLLPVGKGTRG